MIYGEAGCLQWKGRVLQKVVLYIKWAQSKEFSIHSCCKNPGSNLMYMAFCLPSSKAAQVVLAVEDMKDIESVMVLARSRGLPHPPNEL
jgi:hypothetical protein